jgi:hypothetical protein
MKNGMATLRQNGWQCVADGITTVPEVLYVTSKDNWSALPSEILTAPVETGIQ